MGLRTFFVKKLLKSWERSDNERLKGQTFPAGVAAVTDIPYIDDGAKEHLLDIYYPENAQGKLPVIIDIHGGGLLYGGKHLKKIYDGALAAEGNIIFNIDYRLAWGGVTLYDQISDCAAALKWISAHMYGYPADRNKVFITGDSAGGLLAAIMSLLSVSPRLRRLYCTDDFGLNIRAAGLISGMLNFYKPSLPYRGQRSMCLPKRYKNTELFKSLIFSDLPEMKDFPPVYMASSREDPLRAMSFDFEKNLKKYGVPYKFTYLKKVKGDYFGHIHNVKYPFGEKGKKINGEMLEFFYGSVAAGTQ